MGSPSRNGSADIRIGKAEPTMRARGDKSEGGAGELFGETGLAARAPYSRLEHIFDAAESSLDVLFEGLSLHVFAHRHGLQSYPDRHNRATL
jgi:hypothetical protein